MLKTHARYSPSSSIGWMNCPGYESQEGSSVYAAEGNVTHDLAAKLLLDGMFDLQGMVGTVVERDGYEIEVTQEMADMVLDYVSFVYRLPGAHHVETALSLEPITHEAGAEGTADFVAVDFNKIHVVDLKTGRAIVPVKNNTQLMLYGLAAVHHFDHGGQDIEEITLTIFQPRIGNIESWTVSRLELEQFGDKASEAAQNHGTPGAELVPGPRQCKYCKHAGSCEAQVNMALSTIADDFVDLTKDVEPRLKQAIELVKNVDAATLSRMARAAPFIEQWVDAVNARVKELLEQGQKVEGMKLVEGRPGHRKWMNEDDVLQAVKALGVEPEVIQTRSLLSPTAAQKKLPKEVWSKVEQLIVRAPGQPTVAPEADKRPAITQVVTL